MSVYEDYEDEEHESIDITFGISKNGRWDLKQFVLSLIINQHGIPLFMSTHSGNALDKNIILEAIKSLKSVLNPESKVYMSLIVPFTKIISRTQDSQYGSIVFLQQLSRQMKR